MRRSPASAPPRSRCPTRSTWRTRPCRTSPGSPRHCGRWWHMAREFRIPSLGADMEGGTLVEWRVQPGSRLRRGDVVALVETSKGIIDVEAYEDGVVERLVVEPGKSVPVGAVLALLAGDAGTPGAAPAQ